MEQNHGAHFALSFLLGLTLPVDGSSQTHVASPIEARVGEYNGRPTLFLNGKPEYPMLYALTHVPGGRWTWEELPQHNLRNFCEAGVRIFQADLWLEQLWTSPDSFDIDLARRQIRGTLQACPDAAVILRFHVTAPRWWRDAHPDEWVRYADTGYMDEHPEGFPAILEEDNYPVRRVSMASETWKSEGVRRLRMFLEKLAATPEGNALAGIQVADGIYGEWHNWGFYRNEPDVGDPMTAHFRKWLAEKYRTDRALREAWQTAGVTLRDAAVPGMEERKATLGIFRDPARERRTVDYYSCVHDLVADNILLYAKTVKETWPRPILTGTFYGYFFSVFGRQAAGGHLALHRVLRSPIIDYLAGPQAYEPESIKNGDPYRSRSLLLSIRLNGKLWLDEMDVDDNIPVPTNPAHDLLARASVANVRRNVLFGMTRGTGMWFYDFGVGGADLDGVRPVGRGSRGTWDHPWVLRDIAAMKKLGERLLGKEYRTGADVLFVYDTKSFLYTASLRGSDPVSNVLIDYATLQAFRSGVVFDPVHIDDLEKVDLSPYRVIVFGNTFVLSEAQRKYVARHVAAEGRTLVWFYAPGLLDGVTLDEKRVTATTGIRVTPARTARFPEIALQAPFDSSMKYTVETPPGTPLFAVEDADAEILGVYSETGKGAIARKTFPHHGAWYVGLPAKGPEPLRTILRMSGAHVYSRQGDIVYDGGGVLVVHTAEGGEHRVSLRNGKEISFDAGNGPVTLAFDSATGESLLIDPWVPGRTDR